MEHYDKEKKIFLFMLIAFGIVYLIVLLIMSFVKYDWAFFVGMSPVELFIIAIAISLQVGYKKFIESNNKTLTQGTLYCAIRLSFDRYTFIAGGREISYKHNFPLKMPKELKEKPYFIVAYDKETDKSVTVRLFAE